MHPSSLFVPQAGVLIDSDAMKRRGGDFELSIHHKVGTQLTISDVHLDESLRSFLRAEMTNGMVGRSNFVLRLSQPDVFTPKLATGYLSVNATEQEGASPEHHRIRVTWVNAN